MDGTGPISHYVGLLKAQQVALDSAWKRDYLAGYLVQGWPELVGDEVTDEKKLVRTWDRNWSHLRSEHGWAEKRIWTRRDLRCLAASPGEFSQSLRASTRDLWLDDGIPKVGMMYEKPLDPKWYRRRKLLVQFIRRRAAFDDLAQEAIRFVGRKNALAVVPQVQELQRLHQKLLSEIWNGKQMQSTYLAWRDALNRISDYATALESSQADTPANTEDAPPEKPRNGRKPTANDRMKAEMAANLEAVKGWTAKQWAEKLGCGQTTIKDTKTWKLLALLRQQAKAEKRQDRHRRQ